MEKKRVNFFDNFRNPSVPLLKGSAGDDKKITVQKCRKGKSMEEINHNSLKYTIDTLQCINQLRSTIAKKHIVYGGTFPIDVPMIQFGESAGVTTTVHHSPSSKHGFETRATGCKKSSSKHCCSESRGSPSLSPSPPASSYQQLPNSNDGFDNNFVLKCNVQSKYNTSTRKTFPIDRPAEDNSKFRGSGGGDGGGVRVKPKSPPVVGGTYPIDAPCCSKERLCHEHMRHNFDCKRAVSEGVLGVVSGQVSNPSYMFDKYSNDDNDYASKDYCGNWNCLSLLKSKGHLHRE